MKLTGVIPNLVSHDLDHAAAFYRDVLGFQVARTVPDAAPYVFVWLQRDDVSVFLNDAKTVAADVPDAHSLVVGQSGVSMFITIEGVADLWEQVRDRATVVMPLKQQWYGMTEFSVADADGYVVTFAERNSGGA